MRTHLHTARLVVRFILVWPTQLDPALRTLFVCVCVYLCVFLCVHVTSNVELRNYVISHQIVIERRVT